MKQPFKPFYRHAISSIIFSLFFLSPSQLFAQIGHSWYLTNTSGSTYPFELKNYSFGNTVDYGNGNEGATAGTIFQPGWTDASGEKIGRALQITLLNLGRPRHCWPSSKYADYFLDDPNYDDERIVAINHWEANPSLNEHLVVAQVRDMRGNDGIKILTTNWCNPIAKDEVFVATAGGQYNLYPLDAIYIRQTGKLYICGYMSRATVPYNHANNMAMIAEYDPTTGGSLQIYGYQYGNVGQYNFNKYMKLRMLHTGPHAGKLLAIGSRNVGINGSKSGSMVTIIDLPSLMPLRSLTLHTPGELDSEDNEYAFDVVAMDDGLYVYSNRFYIDHNTGGPSGFFPIPKHPMITRLEVDLDQGTFNGRVLMTPAGYDPNHTGRESWAWGMNTHGDAAVLIGYQGSWDNTTPCNTNGELAPTMNNINPFYAKIIPSWNSGTGLSASIHNWNIYFTQAATPNFLHLGGELSNIAWPKEISHRFTDSYHGTLLQVFAPQQNVIMPSASPANLLTAKIMNLGLSSGDAHSQLCQAYTDCFPELMTVGTNTTIDTPTWWSYSSQQLVAESKELDVINTFTGNCESYKPTKESNISTTRKTTSIYPNPATDHIQVDLPTAIAQEEVIVTITDIIGRSVHTLYRGKGENLVNKKLPLPALSQGLHIIRVLNREQAIHQERILIQ